MFQVQIDHDVGVSRYNGEAVLSIPYFCGKILGCDVFPESGASLGGVHQEGETRNLLSNTVRFGVEGGVHGARWVLYCRERKYFRWYQSRRRRGWGF